jgi:hypothetical protein
MHVSSPLCRPLPAAVLVLAAALGGCCDCARKQTAPTSAHLQPAPPNAPAARTSPGAALRWSNEKTLSSPRGNLPLHGPFSNDIVSVTAGSLPPHDWLEVTLDLVVIRTWDGSVDLLPGMDAEATGPDYLSISLADGRILLYNTFSNLKEDVFDEASRYQSYPSMIPGDRQLAQTGAAKTNTLGFTFTRATTGITYNMDATYRLRFLVPHHQADAKLILAAMNLQEPEDESWAIGNLQIRPLAQRDVHAPQDSAIAAAFAEALKPDSASAPEAFQTLISGTSRTVNWIGQHVEPRPIAMAAAAPLIKQLTGNSDEDSRQAATKLAELGPQVEVALRDAYHAAGDTGQVHIDNLLQALGVHAIDDPAVRRLMLATRVLEVIGTPEALALRKRLSQQ